MLSRDLTSSLILLMSGAPGLRWVSWTLRMGGSRGEDWRIRPLTAISGESPQGGFRHLPPHFQSEVQHRPASGARAWPERRRRPVLRDFPARGPDSTRNAAAVPSDRSVTGPPGGGRAPRREVARPSGRDPHRPSAPAEFPLPRRPTGAKRLRDAAPARKPPPASGSRAPCGGARSGCPGPASRGRP